MESLESFHCDNNNNNKDDNDYDDNNVLCIMQYNELV